MCAGRLEIEVAVWFVPFVIPAADVRISNDVIDHLQLSYNRVYSFDPVIRQQVRYVRRTARWSACVPVF